MVTVLLSKIQIASEPSTRNAEYDLKHSGKLSFLSEVKYDLYAARSGNIAIEFFNPKQGKPSGIGITKADLWFHVVTKPQSIWVTSVSSLRTYIDNYPPFKTITCGGDDNAAMYLYKQDIIFADIFYRVDKCSTEELCAILSKFLVKG